MSEPTAAAVEPASAEFWAVTVGRAIATAGLPLLFGWILSLCKKRKARRRSISEAVAQVAPPDQTGRTLHQRVQALEVRLDDTTQQLERLRRRLDSEAALNDRRHSELMAFLSDRLVARSTPAAAPSVR